LLSKQDDNQQLKTPCTSDVLNAVNEFFLILGIILRRNGGRLNEITPLLTYTSPFPFLK